MDKENDEFEDEDFEGFYEQDTVPIDEIPVSEMTDEELKIWLDFQPFYYKWAHYFGKFIGVMADLKYIVLFSFEIILYKIFKSKLYRKSYTFILTIFAIMYWFFTFGSETVQVVVKDENGNDKDVIFELRGM